MGLFESSTLASSRAVDPMLAADGLHDGMGSRLANFLSLEPLVRAQGARDFRIFRGSDMREPTDGIRANLSRQ